MPYTVHIDLLFTNTPERIAKTTGISDHNAIFFSRKLNHIDQSNSQNTNRPKSTNMIIPHNQHENVDKALKDIDWSDFMVAKT